jgi:hypothetical protein
MSRKKYVEVLWEHDNLSGGIEAYINAHWEFDPGLIESGYPYNGVKWSNLFESTPKLDQWGVPDATLGSAWKPQYDGIHNGLTADLIAAAEILSEGGEIERSSAMPGGIGAGGPTIQIPFLDGGLFVKFKQWEDDITNEFRASQTTLIEGALAFRVILELLGFEGPRGILENEKEHPDAGEVRRIVSDRVEAFRQLYED